MTDYRIEDWMEVATEGERLTEKEEDIIVHYARALDSGIYTLAKLILDLAPVLAHEEDLLRIAKAMKLLAPVLDRIAVPPGLQQVHAMVEYLCTRLENKDKLPSFRAGTRETTTALQSLTKYSTFPPGDAATTVLAVFALSNDSNNLFKDLTHNTRLELYMLIDILIKKYEKATRRDVKNQDLVEGIVSMGLAEKNPSCLSVLFPLYAYISRHWTLESAELDRIWESYIRYFPITVGGAVGDPSAPTKEKMRDLLLDCIVSNDHYGAKAFERLIEMLDTESDLSATTKNEVFLSLVACVQSYSPAILEQWTKKIWDALKFEIWNGENDDFINGSLNVLNALAVALTDPVPISVEDKNPLIHNHRLEWLKEDTAVTRYILDALNECKSRIVDSRRQYLLPSAKIMYSLGSSSPFAFHLVTNTVLPPLLLMWQNVALKSEKKMLLEAFNSILRARLEHLPQDMIIFNHTQKLASPSVTNRKPATVEEHELQVRAMEDSFVKFQTDLTVDVYFKSVSELKALVLAADLDRDEPHARAAIEGITLLFRIPKYLSLSERHMAVSKMIDIALNTNDSIHESVLKSLTEMSTSEPDVFSTITLERFTAKLPNHLSPEKGQRGAEMSLIRKILDDLVTISSSMPCLKEYDVGTPHSHKSSSFWHRIFDATVGKLLDILDQALKYDDQLEYVKTIIATVSFSLETFDQTLNKASLLVKEPAADSEDSPYTWIVNRLFGLILEQKSTGDNSPAYVGVANIPRSSTQYDDTTVDYVGRIAMIVLRSPRSRNQSSYIRHAHQIISHDSIKAQHTGPQPSIFWTLFTTGSDLGHISESQYKLAEGPSDKCLANVISMYMLAGFCIDVCAAQPQLLLMCPLAYNSQKSEIQSGVSKVTHFDPDIVAAAMIQNAVSTRSQATTLSRMTMLWTLQLLISKFGARDLGDLYSLVSNCSSKNDTEIRHILQTLAYCAAASLAAFSPGFTQQINLMLNNVCNIKFGRVAATSFRILLAPSSIMNKENGCTVRALRLFKLLSMTLQPLKELWLVGDRQNKDNCLISLAGVLAYMEPKIYTQIDLSVPAMLYPMVLDGTNIQNDPWAKATFIKTLNHLVSLCPDLAGQYLRSTILHMTERTHNTLDAPSDSDVVSRGLALDVLANIVKTQPHAEVLKEKTHLAMELNIALDDPSRSVRERAQHCNTALLCLMEPAVGA